MNRWGTLARDHWAEHRPAAYAAITDPDEHFTRLGEHISREITQLQLSMAGDDQPGEGFWGKVSRLQTARTLATEQILRELLPPSEADDAEDQGDAGRDEAPHP